MKQLTIRTLLIALVFGFSCMVGAQEGKKLIEKKEPEKAPANDREFLVHALSGQIAEIKCAELARNTSSNEKIRDFAKMMIDDHSKMRDALLEKAKEMKIAVVEGTEKDHRDRYNRLAKLEGSDFDRAFLSEMIKSHEKGEKMYERWSERAEDAGLRSLSAQALKATRHHLEKARELNKDF